MVAPEGYKKLPPDMTCRGCYQVWQETDGSYWCCGKSQTLAEIERLKAQSQVDFQKLVNKDLTIKQLLEEKANSLATQKNPDLCTACEGSGREQFKRDGFVVQDTPCRRCGGSGRA